MVQGGGAGRNGSRVAGYTANGTHGQSEEAESRVWWCRWRDENLSEVCVETETSGRAGRADVQGGGRKQSKTSPDPGLSNVGIWQYGYLSENSRDSLESPFEGTSEVSVEG